MLENLVLVLMVFVKLVRKVDIVQVLWIPLRVHRVQSVLHKIQLDKHLVYHVFQENFPVLLVLQFGKKSVVVIFFILKHSSNFFF